MRIKADYEGTYRIARTPGKMAESLVKIEALAAVQPDGRMDFDQITLAVQGHRSDAQSAPHAYKFVIYCIRSGWLRHTDKHNQIEQADGFTATSLGTRTQPTDSANPEQSDYTALWPESQKNRIPRNPIKSIETPRQAALCQDLRQETAPAPLKSRLYKLPEK